MDIIKIGKTILSLRKERGYTQESLAERLSVSPQAVSKWENGHSLPETALLPALAKALDTTIDAILIESRMRILSAFYGDGIESFNVTALLDRFICNDILKIDVNAASLACPAEWNRPKFLIVKYRVDDSIYGAFAADGSTLELKPDTEGLRTTQNAEIIAASYGTAKASYDVMHKIEHYKVFNWDEYPANHEIFPSNPTNDDSDFLTLVYLNKNGINMSTCGEGESIAYNSDKTELIRKPGSGEYLIPNVPPLPEFGKGWECSWGAALTSAVMAMGFKTSYEHVMGVSGACYRLAFCSPGWDYSSVDGLVKYDFATPGYKAFGFGVRFADRVEKENRAEERKKIIDEIRHNMPVLAINVRVTHEWGVICGYKNNGADLLCRSKYDGEILNSPNFQSGADNRYDYLPVENWPFIITYFSGQTAPPSAADNLMNSLRVFADCSERTDGGYATGFAAYDVWIKDLLDEAWYKNNGDDQLARRFSVNQFCTLALYDARKAAFVYLSESASLIKEKQTQITELARLFGEIAEIALQIHNMLDSGEYLEGERARKFWTPQMRRTQAELLKKMRQTESSALAIAKDAGDAGREDARDALGAF